MDIEKECKKHGKTIFRYYGKGKNRRLRCKKCVREAVTKRRKKVKDLLLEHFGGCCEICGYNKCNSALSFHHLDPTKKDFGLSEKGNTYSYKKMLEEASKCILVCHNCHSEIHEGLIDSSLLVKTNNENSVNSGKP